MVAKLSEQNAILIARSINDGAFAITVNSYGNIEKKEEFDIPINGVPKQFFKGNDESLLFFEMWGVLTDELLHDQVDYIKLDL